MQLFNDVLPDILFGAMHEKRDTVPATTDHTEILDEVAQQGLLGESSPERVQGQKMERKLFELYLPRTRQYACSGATGDVSDNSHNVSFTNVQLTCLKKAPSTRSMLAYPKWLTPGFELRV